MSAVGYKMHFTIALCKVACEGQICPVHASGWDEVAGNEENARMEDCLMQGLVLVVSVLAKQRRARR